MRTGGSAWWTRRMQRDGANGRRAIVAGRSPASSAGGIGMNDLPVDLNTLGLGGASSPHLLGKRESPGMSHAAPTGNVVARFPDRRAGVRVAKCRLVSRQEKMLL